MNFTVRQANKNDIIALNLLFSEGDEYHQQALPDIFQPSQGDVRTSPYYEKLFADDEWRIFVAQTDNTLVGAAVVYIRQSPDIPIIVPRRFGIIENLIVKKEWRRCGIGKALMEKAHEWFEENDITDMELNVYQFNQNAIKFYEKLGYKTLSRKMRKDNNVRGI